MNDSGPANVARRAGLGANPKRYARSGDPSITMPSPSRTRRATRAELAAEYDVIVVGAGFGGMSAAIQLAEDGARVLVLEALRYPGGCASTFTRGGISYESGATLFSGLGEEGLFARWIERYELDVEVDWIDPLVELRTPAFRLPVARDRARFAEALTALLPEEEAAGAARFLSRQERVADALWSLFDDPALLPPLSVGSVTRHLGRSPRYAQLLPLLGRPLGELLRRDGISDDSPLRVFCDAVAQITVQASAAEAEAPIALSALDYFFRGTGHIRGGIGELAWGMIGAIEAAGGRVMMPLRVERISARDGRFEVHTRRGVASAKHVVANMLPMDVASFARRRRRRLPSEGRSSRAAAGSGAGARRVGAR